MNADDQKLGWDELVEDAIGVNLRGLKTIKTAIMDPAALFSAARLADWKGHAFSPTFRVALFLLAVMMFQQFIWASPTSQMGQSMTLAAEGIAETTADYSAEDLFDRITGRFLLLYPIIYMSVAFLSGMILRIWGKGTPLLARIRLYFAAIIPSLTLVTATSIPFAYVPLEYSFMTNAVLFVVIFAIDSSVVWRGLAGVYKGAARVWRSSLFALTNFIAGGIAAVLIVTIITIWLGMEIGFQGERLAETK